MKNRHLEIICLQLSKCRFENCPHLHTTNRTKIASPKMLASFFVYSKSEYTIKSVSVSGRIHDNSSKANPIVMKFCA
jgi:hypothetical protein